MIPSSLKNNNLYLTPYHEISQNFGEYLSTHHNTNVTYIDSYKTGKNVITPNNIDISTQYIVIVSTNHSAEIINSISEHVDVTNKLLFCTQLNSQFILLKSRLLYRYLYKVQSKSSSVFRSTKRFITHSYKVEKHRATRIYTAAKKLLSYLLQWPTMLGLQLKFKRNPDITKYKNIHAGKRVFIMGTGPSLNKLDLSKLKNEFTIGTNGIYKISKEIDLDYFIYVSDTYYQHHVDGLKSVTCKNRFMPIKLKSALESKTSTSWMNIKYPVYQQVGHKYRVPFSFSTDISKAFYAGGSVTFLALQLAYYMGFDEVILLGIDHAYEDKSLDQETINNKRGYSYSTKEDDNTHFDKDYLPAHSEFHVDLFAMERGYSLAKNIFANNNRSIVNASPGTKLNIYDKVEFDSLFEK